LTLEGYYDTVIVGAGPGGLFCANELSRRGHHRLLLVDRGPSEEERTQELGLPEGAHSGRLEFSSGIGGAGLFSNGALYFDWNAGGFLESWSPELSKSIMSLVQTRFHQFSSSGNTSGPFDPQEIERQLRLHGFKTKRLQGIHHLGVENTAKLIGHIVGDLAKNGVTVSPNSNVLSIELVQGSEKQLTIAKNGGVSSIRCSNLVLAPGKLGANWLENIGKSIGIAFSDGASYVGVRIESREDSVQALSQLGNDPKISWASENIKVKTHCFCAGGYTIPVRYDDCVLVDGISYRNKMSGRSSFNVLVRSPNIRTSEARRIAISVNEIGDMSPLIQLWNDFKSHKKTSPKDLASNSEKPTLQCGVPSNIAGILPAEVSDAVTEFLTKLETAIDLQLDSTIIYAPVVEWWAKRMLVDRFMMTNIEGLYAVGDGAGLSQGITMAAASGILAAKAIMDEGLDSIVAVPIAN